MRRDEARRRLGRPRAEIDLTLQRQQFIDPVGFESELVIARDLLLARHLPGIEELAEGDPILTLTDRAAREHATAVVLVVDVRVAVVEVDVPRVRGRRYPAHLRLFCTVRFGVAQARHDLASAEAARELSVWARWLPAMRRPFWPLGCCDLCQPPTCRPRSAASLASSSNAAKPGNASIRFPSCRLSFRSSVAHFSRSTQYA